MVDSCFYKTFTSECFHHRFNGGSWKNI